MGASLAVDNVGDLWCCWKQELRGNLNTRAQVRAAQYIGGGWAARGIGISVNSAFPVTEPRIAVVGTLPYIAWWDQQGATYVGHWGNGAPINGGWPLDPGPNGNALSLGNPNSLVGGFKPHVANIGGVLWAAYWRPDDGFTGSAIRTWSLAGGVWTQQPLISLGVNDCIMRLQLVDVSGTPWVFATEHIDTKFVRAWELVGGVWVNRGGNLLVNAGSRPTSFGATAFGGVPYIAFQEGVTGGTGSQFGGPNLIYVKRWNVGTSAFVLAGSGPQNVSLTKDAGQPSLAGGSALLGLTWVEGAVGESATLYARFWDGVTWSAADGPLNANPAFSADAPSMVARGTVFNIAWAERASGATKQLYVTGTDAGTPSGPASPAPFGSDGILPSLADNTWQFLGTPGGLIGSVNGVTDEGFSDTVDVPALGKMVVSGKYHNGPATFGEEQNALVAYDLPKHRWDLLEILDGGMNEHLSNIGHTSGNMTLDTIESVLLIRGAQNTLAGFTGNFRLYSYDLVAGRGKRAAPVGAVDNGAPNCISAFDPDRHHVLFLRSNGTVVYDVHSNAEVATIPRPIGTAGFYAPALVYDTQRRLWITFGGSADGGATAAFNSVYTLDPLNYGAGWLLRSTTNTPSVRFNSNAAFDPVNGLMLIQGGQTNSDASASGINDSYLLNPSTWTFTSLGPLPLGSRSLPSGNTAGNMAIYSTSGQCFLVRNGSILEEIYRFKYAPSSVRSIPTAVALAVR